MDALHIRRENYGPEHAEVADSLMHLGLFHLQLVGQAEQAGKCAPRRPPTGALETSFGVDVIQVPDKASSS